MNKVNDKNRFDLNDIDGEIWKDVPEFEDNYAISNYGRVKSKQRTVSCKNGKTYSVEERILSPNIATKGYLYITLNKNCCKKSCILHRLVAELFVPNPDKLPFVDHIDTNLGNCEASNLRWCTASENMNNPTTRKKLKDAYIRNGKPVVQLKDGNVVQVFNYPGEANPYGFHTSNIKKACTGIYKQYKGYQWMYLEDYEKQFGPVHSDN